MTHDVLILGGGPAGATIGLKLSRAGWSTAIVEKKKFPRGKVCGEFISATNLALIKDMGIADLYISKGGPEVRRVGLFAGDTVITATMPETGCSFARWGRALCREQLDTLLIQKAAEAGARIYQPWTACHLQNKGNHFACMITNKKASEEILARVVIIANGSWERGITEINHQPHKASDLLAFKVHFKHCELDKDLMPLITFPGGYGGLVHSDQDSVTLSCCIRRDVLQKIRAQNVKLQAADAVFHHILATCAGAKAVFIHADRDGPWFSTGPIRPGIRKRYKDGIFYVGNIAGEAHPIIAEGISMAMQSAWILSELLISRDQRVISNNDLTDIGNDYSKKWHEQFASRIRVASLLAELAVRPWAMQFVLPIVKQFPKILTYGAKLSGKTSFI